MVPTTVVVVLFLVTPLALQRSFFCLPSCCCGRWRVVGRVVVAWLVVVARPKNQQMMAISFPAGDRPIWLPPAGPPPPHSPANPTRSSQAFLLLLAATRPLLLLDGCRRGEPLPPAKPAAPSHQGSPPPSPPPPSPPRRPPRSSLLRRPNRPSAQARHAAGNGGIPLVEWRSPGKYKCRRRRALRARLRLSLAWAMVAFLRHREGRPQ